MKKIIPGSETTWRDYPIQELKIVAETVSHFVGYKIDEEKKAKFIEDFNSYKDDHWQRHLSRLEKDDVLDEKGFQELWDELLDQAIHDNEKNFYELDENNNPIPIYEGFDTIDVERLVDMPSVIEVDEIELLDVGKTKKFDLISGIIIDMTPDELAEVESKKQKRLVASYPHVVEKLIREKYSLSEELAILRQRDDKPDEFIEYNAYAESCKINARIECGILPKEI